MLSNWRSKVYSKRQRAEGRREKIDESWFQYLARVLIALATAIKP